MKSPLQALHKKSSWLRNLFRAKNLFLLKREDTFDTTLPVINISEENDCYNIDVIAPGFNKEDFKVDIENNILTITAYSISSDVEEDNDMITAPNKDKCQYHSFKRSFHLPENIRGCSISATYKDGMLQLNVPKNVAVKREKVQVL